MVAPYGADSFREALRWSSEIYQALRAVLMEAGHPVGVGDEGGFSPNVSSNEEPLQLIVKGIEKAGLKPGADVGICLDPASSEFYEDGRYNLRTENRTCSSQEMVDYLQKLIETYPICSIEDGLAEDDWEGWQTLNQRLGDSIELIERVEKYNQLLRIEEELGSAAKYAGKQGFIRPVRF
jgi:enolase